MARPPAARHANVVRQAIRGLGASLSPERGLTTDASFLGSHGPSGAQVPKTALLWAILSNQPAVVRCLQPCHGRRSHPDARLVYLIRGSPY
jgi:hypothetical protein